MPRLDLLLLNGERRALDLPQGSGTLANALARLDDWIETADGGWVQKSFIVEARLRGHEARSGDGTDDDYDALDAAAGRMASGRTKADADAAEGA